MSGSTHIVVLIAWLLGVESMPSEDTSLGIVGGRVVNITEVPFMARYRNLDYEIYYGAAIVHPKFVITRAYSYYFYDDSTTPSYVTVGTDDSDSDGLAYDVKDSYPHPKYNYNISLLDYDVALVKLVQPLEFNERIQAIPLADKDIVIPEGAKFNTMGFGVYKVNENNGLVSFKLKLATMSYITRDKCKIQGLTERMICTYNDGFGPCTEDDGGPLTYNNKLLGISSSSIRCGIRDMPDVYTYIPALRDFIDSTIEKNA